MGDRDTTPTVWPTKVDVLVHTSSDTGSLFLSLRLALVDADGADASVDVTVPMSSALPLARAIELAAHDL